MTAFAGWSMPLYYTTIVDEHLATRRACGLTDVSHMGRFRFEGPGAGQVLDRLLTRRVDRLQPGALKYGLLLNERGGILDDVVVGCFEDLVGGTFFLLVVNAANRNKDAAWIAAHLPPEEGRSHGEEVVFCDVTRIWAMLALQGPRAGEILQPLVDVDLTKLGRYKGTLTRLTFPEAKGQGAIVTRTGYTGEDGFELIVGSPVAVTVWEALLEHGKPHGLVVTGLGARDTLRLEASLPLYGQELTEDITPSEAGLDFACEIDKAEFVGKQALESLGTEGIRQKLVCLEMAGKRIARTGFPIYHQGRKVGRVTSGTFSPTLERSIAMGYVDATLARPGMDVEIDIRGQLESARIVPRPFYRRA